MAHAGGSKSRPAPNSTGCPIYSTAPRHCLVRCGGGAERHCAPGGRARDVVRRDAVDSEVRRASRAALPARAGAEAVAVAELTARGGCAPLNRVRREVRPRRGRRRRGIRVGGRREQGRRRKHRHCPGHRQCTCHCRCSQRAAAEHAHSRDVEPLAIHQRVNARPERASRHLTRSADSALRACSDS